MPDMTIQLVERFRIRREEDPVRIGVPFPRGLVQDGSEPALVNEDGLPCPFQASPLARWSDASVQWVFLDFLTAGPESATSRYTLRVGEGVPELLHSVSPFACETEELQNFVLPRIMLHTTGSRPF